LFISPLNASCSLIKISKGFILLIGIQRI
jgi:hypothetical protein